MTLGVKRVVNIVEAEEVEGAFKRVFGDHPYSFRRTEYAHLAKIGEGQITFHVTGQVDEDDDEEDIALIKMGKVPDYRNNLLLNLMARDGHIDVGWYLVRV